MIENDHLGSSTEAMRTHRFDFENSRSVRKTLNNNELNLVTDQRFWLKQWFPAGAHSCRLKKTGFTHCYLRISVLSSQTIHTCFAVAFRTQASITKYIFWIFSVFHLYDVLLFLSCKTLANEISGNSSLQMPTFMLLAGGEVASAAASARLKSLGERGTT